MRAGHVVCKDFSTFSLVSLFSIPPITIAYVQVNRIVGTRNWFLVRLARDVLQKFARVGVDGPTGTEEAKDI